MSLSPSRFRSPRAPGHWVPAAVLGSSMAYAFARYVVFGDVEVGHAWLFVANKGAALAALILLALSVSLRAARALRLSAGGHTAASAYGRLALALALGHAFASLALLRPAVFPAFFRADGWLTPLVELALLSGVIALGLLGGRAPLLRAPLPRALALLALMAAHSAALGAPRWLPAERWPAGLPPITLLSTAVAIGAGVAIFIARGRTARSPRM